MMQLFCRLGFHDDELAYGRRATKDDHAVPMRMRCSRCGRETPGWDVGAPPVVRFAGYLTASEVRSITRRTKRRPAYVSPQVEAELARVVAIKPRKRGPAIILAMREGGKR